MSPPRFLRGTAAALLALWCGGAAAQTPAPRLPTIFASPIHAGCRTFDSRTCQIVVEPFTINIASGRKLSLFQIVVDGFVVYDWRPDQSNPVPVSGTTYTPSRVALGFGVRCGMNHVVSLYGRDTGDSGTFVLGTTSPVSCPIPDPGLLYHTIPPCRVVDTRAASGFPAGYGPPSLPGVHAQRDFVFWERCGIPAGAQAVSANVTVWAPVTRGDMRIFAAGGATPTVSNLNWEPNIQALANAGLLQLGPGGTITVQIDGPGTVDMIVDVNGYFQ